MPKQKIFFRADAGHDIGYGHFIRSLALADMLKDDFDCTFFTQTPTDFQRSEADNVCRLVSVPSDDSKFNHFLDQLDGSEIVVLDNYFYSPEYQKGIKEKGCRLVCIDDIHDRHFHADAIINHCITDCSCYDIESSTFLFLGPKWALLRKPFLSNIKINDGNSWLITFGGTDEYNLTEKYATFLASNGIGNISVLIGDQYAFKSSLEKIKGLRIYSNLSADHVAELMISSGKVICSASSVCYESLACGCKVFAGYYADNQKEFYDNLVKHKLIYPLGNLLQKEACFDIQYPIENNPLSFSNISTRYINLFKALSLTYLSYYEMTDEQSRSVWECRNREEIRQWMSNPCPFTFDSHKSFVNGLKNKTDKQYYAFFNGNEFIGSYDFVDIKNGESAERGLFVNPDYHGKGIASVMETLMDGLIRKYNISYLNAEVLKTNRSSIKYHMKSGYILENEDGKYYYFKKYLV